MLLATAALVLQTFTGLSLQSAQANALARSPDVAAATSKVTEEQAMFDAARASYGPALMTNYALAPQGGPNNATVAQRMTTVGAQVTLGDLIAYSPLVAQANAALRAAQSDLANVRRDERVNVISLYFAALSASGTLDARRVALTGARADLRAARLRFKSGDVPRLDVVRAEVAVAQAQADLSRAQADADNALSALSIETGVPVKQLVIASTQSSPPPAFAGDAASAVRQALAHRPEIASARANVAAEEHAVAVARRGGLPVVSVSGGYTSGVDSGVKVAGPSLTVNAALPIGGAAADRVRAEEARLAQAQAQLAKLKRQIETNVAAAVRTYTAQTAALAAAQRALAQARAELTAVETGYRSGASSSLDVATARATYVQALVSETAALYSQSQARATLDLLIGTNHA